MEPNRTMEILHQRTQRPTVLYLDDEPGNRQAFQAAFRRAFNVVTAGSVEEALRLFEHHDIHVFIADQRMPGMTGSEVLALVRHKHPNVRRMLLTAYADLDAVVNAINQGGACYYVRKPWEHREVVEAVESAFRDLVTEREQAVYTARLIQSNQQLEFALRQRLIS
jgi:response regulator RpfG family c-di-GMP phosphodiesterase